MRIEVRFEARLGDMMGRSESRDLRGIVEVAVVVIAGVLSRVKSESLAKTSLCTRDFGSAENVGFFVDMASIQLSTRAGMQASSQQRRMRMSDCSIELLKLVNSPLRVSLRRAYAKAQQRRVFERECAESWKL